MLKKVLVIGCGAISESHVSALLKRNDAVIAAICDTDGKKALALSEKFGLSAAIHTDYKEAVEKEKPDLAHICTPHYLHCEMAVFCLEKNVNVILEKPACMNGGELAVLKKAVKASSAKLAVSFQNRFVPATIEAKRIIDSEELGKVLGVRGIMTWKREGAYYTDSPWRGKIATEGGGVLMNQSIHTLDMMIHLCGNVADAHGKISNYRHRGITDTEDTAEICLDFESGARGIFFATNAYSNSVIPTVTVNCEKGMLSLEGGRLFVNGALAVDADPSVPVGKSVWGNGHPLLFDEVYTSGIFSPDIEDASRVLEVIWKIYAENRG